MSKSTLQVIKPKVYTKSKTSHPMEAEKSVMSTDRHADCSKVM